MGADNLLFKLITPDWQITWDTKQIAEEIPGFQFLGAGWYSKQGTWMLVVPTLDPEVFTLQVFFDRDPRGGYAAIADAPVRQEAISIANTLPNFSGLLILLVGMLVLLPLSGFLMHKFGFLGVGIMLVLVALWGVWLRRIKSKTEKRT